MNKKGLDILSFVISTILAAAGCVYVIGLVDNFLAKVGLMMALIVCLKFQYIAERAAHGSVSNH